MRTTLDQIRGQQPRTGGRFNLEGDRPDPTFYAGATGAGRIAPEEYVETVGEDTLKKASRRDRCLQASGSRRVWNWRSRPFARTRRTSNAALRRHTAGVDPLPAPSWLGSADQRNLKSRWRDERGARPISRSTGDDQGSLNPRLFPLQPHSVEPRRLLAAAAAPGFDPEKAQQPLAVAAGLPPSPPAGRRFHPRSRIRALRGRRPAARRFRRRSYLSAFLTGVCNMRIPVPPPRCRSDRTPGS